MKLHMYVFANKRRLIARYTLIYIILLCMRSRELKHLTFAGCVPHICDRAQLDHPPGI